MSTNREAVARYRARHPERVRAYHEAHRADARERNAGYRAQGRTNLARARDRHRERRYALSSEEFAAMLEAQGGKCALCRCAEPGGVGTWHVDHDHATGERRGLLCMQCNIGIGNLNDDPDLLRRAIDYLEGNLS